MSEEKNYIPEKGDIVWINFDPSTGKEIEKRRPGLVVSRYEFNRTTLFAIICPITTTIKDQANRYLLPDEIQTAGQVIISQLKSLDFQKRELQYIEKLPDYDVSQIEEVIEYIF
ncbi:type II toxin-antitoxin system PemK/MazF family toxin [Xylocopilactobacillus apis]|uniref:mRNA interferase PemK n=1 Tax=Xylocopilactobacillus apis TaxID=2932183 RepID=A0AAU9CTQ2_9LACO|nr:type II toxin-antitoxin system PemK/MazF family toxin [Xylocopilactobacillus apis]BDR57352.1 mRNA interferase PemK [Xylocopilactobacillus apis]